MHYEIEQAGDGSEHRPDIGTHAQPERWHVVRVAAPRCSSSPPTIPATRSASTWTA